MPWMLLIVALCLAACRPSPPVPEPVPPPLPEASAPCHLPDPKLTPGKLCAADDPDFLEYRYAEHVAICRRHLTQATKDAVARRYGRARADASIEVDHLLALAVGGSNSPENLWIQEWPDAHAKDRIEDSAYRGLLDGTLKQADAVRMLLEWRPDGCR